MSERLHKVLATHGFGSRREIEAWIAAGRISLNGQPAQVGDKFKPGDRVVLDGKDVTGHLALNSQVRVLLYHKPQAQPLEHEEGGTIESVTNRLPAERGVRWIPINPMHPGDSGLLLVTNNGELSYALTRHKRSIPAAYAVRVHAPMGPDDMPALPLSIQYDDESVEFTKVEVVGGEGSNIWFRVDLLRADRRAAVRALFESHQLKVSRMTQVSFGGIGLPRDLPRGRHRELPREQLALLYQLAELPPPQNVAASPGARQRKNPTRKRVQRR